MASVDATNSSAQHVSWAVMEDSDSNSLFIDDDETDDGYSYYDGEESLNTYNTGMTSVDTGMDTGIHTSPEYYDVDLSDDETSVSVVSKGTHQGGRSLTSAPAEMGKSDFGHDPIKLHSDPVLQWLDNLVGEERLRKIEEDYENMYSALTQCWAPILGETDERSLRRKISDVCI